KQLASPDQPHVFTWIGKYSSPGDVLDLAVTKAMSSTHSHLVDVLRNNGNYTMLYDAAFAPSVETDPDIENVFNNVARAFSAYLTTDPFVTTNTPFDTFIVGGPTTMSASAQ